MMLNWQEGEGETRRCSSTPLRQQQQRHAHQTDAYQNTNTNIAAAMPPTRRRARAAAGAGAALATAANGPAARSGAGGGTNANESDEECVPNRNDMAIHGRTATADVLACSSGPTFNIVEVALKVRGGAGRGGTTTDPLRVVPLTPIAFPHTALSHSLSHSLAPTRSPVASTARTTRTRPKDAPTGSSQRASASQHSTPRR